MLKSETAEVHLGSKILKLGYCLAILNYIRKLI